MPDPQILNPRDAIVKITSTAICGSDLHLYNGLVPTMEKGDIKPGNVVAVWGCGPVGQFAMQSAWLLGAEKVIGIDRFPERLLMASEKSKAITLDYEEVDVATALKDLTGGRGPDACIDAVDIFCNKQDECIKVVLTP